MAKYYLGKKVNGEWIPVSDNLCETDIMSVINFTSDFSSDFELKSYLACALDLDISRDDELAYIIKKSNGYSKIYNGEHICYSLVKDLTNANYLLTKLKEEKYNLELFAYLANNLTNKYKNNLNVEELSRIKEVVREVNYAKSIGIANYETTLDKRDLNSLISAFVKSSIVKKENGEYKTSVVDGVKSYDTDKRALADLILLLNVYYSIKENEKIVTNPPEELIAVFDGDKEEFLTDAELYSMGYDPDDIKKLMRNK